MSPHIARTTLRTWEIELALEGLRGSAPTDEHEPTTEHEHVAEAPTIRRRASAFSAPSFL